MIEYATSILLIIIVLYLYVKYALSYWTRNEIAQIPPTIPFGNVGPIILKTTSFGRTFREFHNYFKNKKEPIGGFYLSFQPQLIIVDPDMIKQILTRDFGSFNSRGLYVEEKNDPLSAHLFALSGTKWKNMRAKLTPTFTSGKMKSMFPIMLATSKELISILDDLNKNNEPIDINEVLSRFTIDIIGQCAFGIECNSLQNPENKLKKIGLSVIDVKGFDILRQVVLLIAPEILRLLRITCVNTEANKFFLNVVKDTVSHREKNNIKRIDFLQLLIDMKNQGSFNDNDKENPIDELTIEQIAAQCFVFFLAGYESSSTAMTFCLYEVASNTSIQDKIREEFNQVLEKYDGNVTYDAIKEMHYLDKVFSETLRKYPPLPFLNRAVTRDYRIPNTNFIAKQGTPLIISIEGLHWDPEYFPEPKKFDPERFSEEENLKRKPYTYIPFGEGPRICIGLRFGKTQAKVGLISILRNFKCTLNSKTSVPIVMKPSSFVTKANGGIWLNMEKIKNI